jgi:excisionase family DNA binding protein
MPRLLTPADVAEQWSVSTKTVLRMIDAGALPALRFGPRLVRIRPEDVEAAEVALTRGVPEVKSAAPRRDARLVALQERHRRSKAKRLTPRDM